MTEAQTKDPMTDFLRRAFKDANSSEFRCEA